MEEVQGSWRRKGGKVWRSPCPDPGSSESRPLPRRTGGAQVLGCREGAGAGHPVNGAHQHRLALPHPWQKWVLEFVFCFSDYGMRSVTFTQAEPFRLWFRPDWEEGRPQNAGRDGKYTFLLLKLLQWLPCLRRKPGGLNTGHKVLLFPSPYRIMLES